MEHDRYIPVWYAKRDGTIRGPYSPKQVTRYMLLGRIRLDDLLSQDQKAWVAAQSVSELMPQELVLPDTGNEHNLLTAARLQHDERADERRNHQGAVKMSAFQSDRRTHIERRQVDGRHFISRAAADTSTTHRFRASSRTQIRTFLYSVLLATLILAWLTPAVT